jgi:UDP-N-acetylmuramate dehydrogenase
VGGAVYGNAGAFGSNTQASLLLAKILHRTKGYLSLTSEGMGYAYRSSALKRQPGDAIILSASFSVQPGDPALIEWTMKQFSERRRSTQPTGPSTGSTFKNPPGDFAGRLIEAAGLKGTRIGGVSINEKHANFFINDGTAKAQDYYDLIQLARQTVFEQFGVSLETEIEVIGDWQTK